MHVTRDSDTTFKVKSHLAGGGAYCGGLPHRSLFLFADLLNVMYTVYIYSSIRGEINF